MVQWLIVRQSVRESSVIFAGESRSTFVVRYADIGVSQWWSADGLVVEQDRAGERHWFGLRLASVGTAG